VGEILVGFVGQWRSILRRSVLGGGKKREKIKRTPLPCAVLGAGGENWRLTICPHGLWKEKKKRGRRVAGVSSTKGGGRSGSFLTKEKEKKEKKKKVEPTNATSREEERRAYVRRGKRKKI